MCKILKLFKTHHTIMIIQFSIRTRQTSKTLKMLKVKDNVIITILYFITAWINRYGFSDVGKQ